MTGSEDDFTIPQAWHSYAEAEHALWRALYARQRALLAERACREYLTNLDAFDVADGIPDFARVSRMLAPRTGWSLVAVPGIVPAEAFFRHLAERRFPVTRWLRRPDQIDYLEEPDIFHDFFGHVPLLADPVFARYMAEYGRKALDAIALDALVPLTRLYWYIVEFGLIRTAAGLRICGAGIMSSRAESMHCLDSDLPNRIGFDLERIMRTDYRIDAFQETYFVLDGFEQLFEATRQDLAPVYARVKALPDLPANAVLPGDRVIHHGTRAFGTAA